MSCAAAGHLVCVKDGMSKGHSKPNSLSLVEVRHPRTFGSPSGGQKGICAVIAGTAVEK